MSETMPADDMPADDMNEMGGETGAGTGRIVGLLRALHWLGIYVTLPVLTGIVGLDVFLRYVMRSPLPWGNEVGSLLLLVVFVVSFPYATHLGSHVRMDLFYVRFGAAARRRADAVSALCGLGLAGPLAYQSFVAGLSMFRLNEGAGLIDLPFWPFAALFGLASTLVCLQFLAVILRSIRPGQKQNGDGEER